MKKLTLLERTVGHLTQKGMKPAEAQRVALKTLRDAGDIHRHSLALTAQGKYREKVPSSQRPDNKPGAFSRPTKY